MDRLISPNVMEKATKLSIRKKKSQSHQAPCTRNGVRRNNIFWFKKRNRPGGVYRPGRQTVTCKLKMGQEVASL